MLTTIFNFSKRTEFDLELALALANIKTVPKASFVWHCVIISHYFVLHQRNLDGTFFFAALQSLNYNEL